MIPYELQLAWAKWTATDPVFRWALVFYVTQVADSVTTFILLKMGGREGNLLARKLMEKLGVIPVLVGGKVLSIATVYFGAHKMGADTVMLLAVAYVALIIWNIGQIAKQREYNSR